MKKFVSIGLLVIFIGTTIAYTVMQFTKKNGNANNNNNPDTTVVNKPMVTPPQFNADSAYIYTQKQVDFGPRIPGTPAQTKCAAWLTAELKRFTKDVIVQEAEVKIYNGKMVPMKNIIASFNPSNPKRVLLFAHWDTRPWPDQDPVNKKGKLDGADDAASGVGTLLEIARCLAQKEIGIGIDIALFDVEDYGPPSFETQWDEKDTYCLGTQYWCNKPHEANYRGYYGILLDMAGAKGAQFRMEGGSSNFAPTVLQNIWSTASSLGYGNFFINERASTIIDDHYYVNTVNGTPCVDIIWLDPTTKTGFAPHWHTQNDNMSIIDKAALKAVGQTILQVIYNEEPTS